MANSTQTQRDDTASFDQRSSTLNCPVVKAAFNSAVGIDVHHKLLVCAHQSFDSQAGEIFTEVVNFGTTVSALKSMVQWIQQRHPQRILMESTGVLWLSPYEALEDAGFGTDVLALINARDFKAVAGRKTDTQDAIRLAEYARLGNIRCSFVVPRRFREQRQVARQIAKHTEDLKRCKSRFIKTLNFVGCRPTAAFSDVYGSCAQKILLEYIRGGDVLQVARSFGRRLRHTPEQIQDILGFKLSENVRNLLNIQLQEIETLEKTINELWALLRRMQCRDEKLLEGLIKIPGIRETAARLLFAELTDNLSSFSTSEHFASWTGLCPGNNESAGKRSSSRTAKGNKWVRRVLIECAQALALSRNGELYKRFLAIKQRRGYRRAIVAIAHLLVRLVYAYLKNGVLYVKRPDKSLRKLRITKYERSVSEIRKENFVIEANGTLVDKETGVIRAI